MLGEMIAKTISETMSRLEQERQQARVRLAERLASLRQSAQVTASPSSLRRRIRKLRADIKRLNHENAELKQKCLQQHLELQQLMHRARKK